MLNIFSLIYVCLNSVLYLNNFFFGKLPEAYAFLNPLILFIELIWGGLLCQMIRQYVILSIKGTL